MILERLGWEPSTPLAVGLEKTYTWIHDQLAAKARTARPAVAST
jgi:dTDP-D-glucose 4,6-dehydratase